MDVFENFTPPNISNKSHAWNLRLTKGHECATIQNHLFDAFVSFMLLKIRQYFQERFALKTMLFIQPPFSRRLFLRQTFNSNFHHAVKNALFYYSDEQVRKRTDYIRFENLAFAPSKIDFLWT